MADSPAHRSGFVAVVGRPNTGKSTLLNAVLRQKVAGVSPWPQTTRRRQFGILTLPEAQVILMDTPGLHSPKDAFGRAMIHTVEDTISQSDLVLYLVDLGKAPDEEERILARWTEQRAGAIPIMLVLNKTDAVPVDLREERAAAYRALLPKAEDCRISTLRAEGLDALIRRLVERLPEGPVLYPEEDLTDLSEREVAAEFIREAALNRLRAEVPHGIAVRMDQYHERGEAGASIEATIFVEKESHKGIVIGKGGAMLKAIGIEARKKIEEMNGRSVFLQLRVKVLPGWRGREDTLRRFGYGPKEGKG